MNRQEQGAARAAKARLLIECRQRPELQSLAKLVERSPLREFASRRFSDLPRNMQDWLTKGGLAGASGAFGGPVQLARFLSKYPAAIRAKLRRRLFKPVDPTGQLGETFKDLMVLMETSKPEPERFAAADRILYRVRQLLYYGGHVERDRVKGGRQAARKHHEEYQADKAGPWVEEWAQRVRAGEKSAAVIRDMEQRYKVTQRHLRRVINPRRRRREMYPDA